MPQTQRWFRGPVLDADGEQTDEGGDCFAACLASLLELPIEGFPNYLDSRPLGSGGWWHKWNLWLYENFRSELIFWERDELPDPAGLAWWIAVVMIGKIRHAVVFYGDEFRWDPAPEVSKRVWTLADVKAGAALYSITSIFGREDGPYQATHDVDGNPIEEPAAA